MTKSVNLDESEATKLYNLDKITVTCIYHAHNHFELYSTFKKLLKTQIAWSYCINNP